jgi:hypothetical protein
VQGFKCLMPRTLHDVVQKVVIQEDFSFVEMASGAKQKVGGKVTGCALNLGEFVTRVNLYVTILGSYDVVIGMDWLESHKAILNRKTKRLSLDDDEGRIVEALHWLPSTEQGYDKKISIPYQELTICSII